MKFVVTEEEKKNILNLYKPLLKEQENMTHCVNCNVELDCDSDYDGDLETMGGHPVEPLICPQCGQKYERIGYGDSDDSFCYRD